MRTAFINKLTELAHKDSRVYLITSDTGFKVFDDYQKIFPKRYLNIGISEASMIGVAAGLALSGKIVFVYGIVPFVTMRCFEQIRNDLCMQNLPVKIVGVGQGFTYGGEGATHHAIEDIAVMSCLPNMTVVCPGDPVETEKAMEASMLLEGPAYFRIGKSGEKVLHTNGLPGFEIGKGILLSEGDDLALIATGNMLETAIDVADSLRQKGFSPAVVSMHTVKPIDRKMIKELSKKYGLLATIEEHSHIGGLGSMVANVISDENLDVELVKFAVPDMYVNSSQNQESLRNRFGLSRKKIADKMSTILSK